MRLLQNSLRAKFIKMPKESSRPTSLVTGEIEDFSQLLELLKMRFFRIINHLTIYVYILVVCGSAVVTDYLLLGLIERLLIVNVQRYPMVALWFDRAKIAIALLCILVAFVIGVFSTIYQIKTYMTASRESDQVR